MTSQPELFPEERPPVLRRSETGWFARCPRCATRLVFDRPTATEAARAAQEQLVGHVCAGPREIPY